jgi:hypothetical protein
VQRVAVGVLAAVIEWEQFREAMGEQVERKTMISEIEAAAWSGQPLGEPQEGLRNCLLSLEEPVPPSNRK